MLVLIDNLEAAVIEYPELAGQVDLNLVAGGELLDGCAVDSDLVVRQQVLDLRALALGHRRIEEFEQLALPGHGICLYDVGTERVALGSRLG